MSSELYPLTFQPVFGAIDQQAEETVPCFARFLQRVGLTPSSSSESGFSDECWLLADSELHNTEITNGSFSGMTLRELAGSRPKEVMGRNYSGNNRFPLALRLYAPAVDQPLLVHPDEDAQVELYDKYGNMKFWYSLDASREAWCSIGLTSRASRQRFFQKLDTPEVKQFLQKLRIRSGDTCLLPPGSVHTLSRDNLILEIMPRPAPALRLGTWSGEGGNDIPQAEKETARQCLKMESRQGIRIPRFKGPMARTRKIPLTAHWPWFSVEEIRIGDHIYLETTADHFNLLYQVSGSVTVQTKNSPDLELTPGQICCIPAAIGPYKLITSEPSELLRIGPHSVL